MVVVHIQYEGYRLDVYKPRSEYLGNANLTKCLFTNFEGTLPREQKFVETNRFGLISSLQWIHCRLIHLLIDKEYMCFKYGRREF